MELEKIAYGMYIQEASQKFLEWTSSQLGKPTQYQHDRNLNLFCLYFHNRKIESITINDISVYINELLRFGWQKQTVSHKCSTLRMFFRFLKLQGERVINYELIPVIKPDLKLPRVADFKKYKMLMDFIPDNGDPRHIRNKAMISMLWDTGMRCGELVSLNVSDLDLKSRKAKIRTEKSRRRPFRDIFWQIHGSHPYLLEWLKRRESFEYKIIDKDALFISISASNVGHRLTNKAVNAFFRGYSERMGVPTINAHSFRHGFAHEIIKHGGSNADIVNLLGHADVKSTSIYTMMFGTEAEERYRKLKGR